MSNEIYGYVVPSPDNELLDFSPLLEEKTGIGFSSISVSELYNFPENFLPKNEDNAWCFLIGDKPGKKNATYLIDNIDYAHQANINLPHKGEKRLEILVESIITMIELTKAKRVVIALTDSSQIEEVKFIQLPDILSVFISDFKDASPPDCLYDVAIE